MACQIAVIRMTLSDLQGRLPIACLFECDFSYSYAALDKISADIERRALSLRRLRFLFQKVKRTWSASFIDCRALWAYVAFNRHNVIDFCSCL